MAIYKSELLGRHIDVSRILAISDARFIDRMGYGGWFVGFEILFQLQDKPLEYVRSLDRSEYEFVDGEDGSHHELVYVGKSGTPVLDRHPSRNPNVSRLPILAVANLQRDIDKLVAVWKEVTQGGDPERAELERKVAALERLRPVWAMGYTSDSIAAQTTTAALTQLWGMLGAKDQTDAVRILSELGWRHGS